MAGARTIAIATALSAALLASAPAATLADASVPPPGQTLVLVGQDPQSTADYVSQMGRVPAGFMDYAFLEAAPADFAAHLEQIGQYAAQYPGTNIQIGLTMGASAFWNTLNGSPQVPGAVQVVQGAYDQNIAQLASWLKGLDATVYLRIGYEFDLLGGQWGTADEYKAAYRYIVDHLRAAGVTNALYVWHSAGAYFRTTDYSFPTGLLGTADRSGGDLDPLLTNLADAERMTAAVSPVPSDPQPIGAFYPGRSYVDLFAISYWDDCYGFGRSSDAMRAEYRQRTREILSQAQAMGLPLMIGESTPAYIGFKSGAQSVTWIQRYAQLAKDFDLRAVSLIVPNWPAIDGGYWGQPYWNGYWPDARVWHYPDAKAAWTGVLDDPRFVERAG